MKADGFSGARKIVEPTLALCNIFEDAEALARFGEEHGFRGIDWSFSQDLDKDTFLKDMRHLKNFDIRFHCRFPGVDIAYADERAESALDALKRSTELAAAAGGGHMTVHIGLGVKSVVDLDWDRAVDNLAELVAFSTSRGVKICLENLPVHWTCDPEAFEKLVVETGAGVTFDIGHAHISPGDDPISVLCERFVVPHIGRVHNAHVYHTEVHGVGHLPPESVSDVEERLSVLQTIESCDWWVLELADPRETLQTRDIVLEHLRAKVLPKSLLA